MLGAVMAGMFVVMYVGAIGMAFINLAQAPLFNPSRFEMRDNEGKVKFVSEYHVIELKHYIHHKNRGCTMKHS